MKSKESSRSDSGTGTLQKTPLRMLLLASKLQEELDCEELGREIFVEGDERMQNLFGELKDQNISDIPIEVLVC